MHNYARVQDGVVQEILATDQPVENLFHPDLIWVRLSDGSPAAPGWRYDGTDFSEPPAVQNIAEAPSLHSVMAALANVQEQLAAMRPGS